MAHSDLNELLNYLLDVAERLLKEHGAFLPVGAIMLSNGEVRHIAAQVEGNEYPGAQPLIEILTVTFQKEAAVGRLRAAGMAYDVMTVPPGKQQKQDAICCSLEHCLGEAVDVFKPYIRTEDGKLQFDETFAAARTQQFFCQLPRG